MQKFLQPGVHTTQVHIKDSSLGLYNQNINILPRYSIPEFHLSWWTGVILKIHGFKQNNSV
jgi:hypothetical protein